MTEDRFSMKGGRKEREQKEEEKRGGGCDMGQTKVEL